MKVLCVIDMQHDFIDAALGSNEAKATVENVIKEIRKDEYDVILATMDTHDDNYLNTTEGKHLPVKHCIKGSEGWQLDPRIDEALNQRNAYIYAKETFGSDKLVAKLKELAPDTIVFVGLCTDICVVANAITIKTYLPNSTIQVVENATAGSSIENKAAALKTMQACHIEII